MTRQQHPPLPRMQVDQSPVGPLEERNIGIFRLIFGAVGFPFAFTAIVVCGAELYTSLCAYMMAAWWEGTVSIPTILRVLATSW
jgi:formate/nitrite transporter FocA (FNT family)